ncbi:hypothetical protein HDV05_005353 [Chytridiales sp. JEL 0842]|nr:hypothetical protein HDV05_005353 [Chytridiales sp. JEL 0842]
MSPPFAASVTTKEYVSEKIESPPEMITSAQALEALVHQTMQIKTQASTGWTNAADEESRVVDSWSLVSTKSPSNGNSLLSPRNPLSQWDFPESIFVNPSVSMTSNISEITVDEAFLRSIMSQDATSSPGTSADINDILLSLSATTNPHTTISAMPHTLSSPYQDLERHLIAIYFAYVNPGCLLLKEDAFFENYLPVNHHPPALINAMKGLAVLYSNHPQIYKEHKTRFKASKFYMDLAEKQVTQSMETIPATQSMALLGIYAYGVDYGQRSYQWVGQASREAEKFELILSDREFYRFSVWAKASTQFSPMQREIGRRMWYCVYNIDAYCSMVSGLPLSINETEYEFLLTRSPSNTPQSTFGQTWCNDSAQDSKNVADSGGGLVRGVDKRTWVASFAIPPLESIYDIDGETRPHALADQMKRQKNPTLPLYMNCDADDSVYVGQITYIIRRVNRFKRWTPVSSTTPTSATLTPLCGINQSEVLKLHDIIIKWYDSLPPHCKAFRSLADFSDQNTSPPFIPPSAGPHQEWALRVRAVEIQLLFTSALTLLHDPASEFQSSSLSNYRVTFQGGNSQHTVTTFQLLTLIQRAQFYIIRCVYASTGIDQPPEMILSGQMNGDALGHQQSFIQTNYTKQKRVHLHASEGFTLNEQKFA